MQREETIRDFIFEGSALLVKPGFETGKFFLTARPSKGQLISE